MPDKPTTQGTGAALGVGGLVMLVCCGGHLLVLAVFGGLAVGTLVGLVGGALAAMLLLAGAVVVGRRRRTAACHARHRAGASRSQPADVTTKRDLAQADR